MVGTDGAGWCGERHCECGGFQEWRLLARGQPENMKSSHSAHSSSAVITDQEKELDWQEERVGIPLGTPLVEAPAAWLSADHRFFPQTDR